MSHNVTINLPEMIFIRAEADGTKVQLETGKLSAEVVAQIFTTGAKTVLTNAFNSGGKDKADSERFQSLRNKLAAWYRGEFIVAERGDSFMTELKEQFISEQMEATGATAKQVEKGIAELVRSTFGEKEKAGFSRFLDAVAAGLLKASLAEDPETDDTLEDIRTGIEQDLAERMQAAKQARAEKMKGLDTKGLMLSAFKK